jgi:hypothetical protein
LGLGFGLAFAFGCGGGDFFAGLGEFGFHVFPGGVEGGFVDGEVADVDGLATAGETGGHFLGSEEGVAAPGGEVVDLAEEGVADHFHADFVPGAGLKLDGEDGVGDGFVGAFMVVVVAADGDGVRGDVDAGHVVLDGVDAEAGGFGAFELEFVFDDEVGDFVGHAEDSTVFVGREFGTAQGAVDDFPFAFGGFPGGGESGVEFAFEEDFARDGEERFGVFGQGWEGGEREEEGSAEFHGLGERERKGSLSVTFGFPDVRVDGMNPNFGIRDK